VIPATTLGDQITIAAWTKLEDGVTNIQAILSSFDGRSGFSLGLNWWLVADRIVLLETWSQQRKIKTVHSGPNAVNYMQWHHVVATMDRPSNSAILYVDGERVAAKSFAGDFADSKPLSIGRYHGGIVNQRTRRPVEVPFHFTGLIDDLRIYDEVLTQAEIKILCGHGAAAASDVDSSSD
jgi:hypothetical protein